MKVQKYQGSWIAVCNLKAGKEKVVLISLQYSLRLGFHRSFVILLLDFCKPFMSYAIFTRWLYAAELLSWHNCTFWVLYYCSTAHRSLKMKVLWSPTWYSGSVLYMAVNKIVVSWFACLLLSCFRCSESRVLVHAFLWLPDPMWWLKKGWNALQKLECTFSPLLLHAMVLSWLHNMMQRETLPLCLITLCL